MTNQIDEIITEDKVYQLIAGMTYVFNLGAAGLEVQKSDGTFQSFTDKMEDGFITIDMPLPGFVKLTTAEAVKVNVSAIK